MIPSIILLIWNLISTLKGSLVFSQDNEKTKIALPARTLPLKIIEWDLIHLVVFTRELYSNRIQVWMLDVIEGDYIEIPLPKLLSQTMFRQAIKYNDHVVLIQYDPIRKTNYLYRFLPSNRNEVGVRFDEAFEYEIYISEHDGYRQQPHILFTIYQNVLYILSGSNIFEYSFYPSKNKAEQIKGFELLHNYKVLELSADENAIYALYEDNEYSANDSVSDDNFPFVLLDVVNQKFVRIKHPEQIPYNLQVIDGKPNLSYVESMQDIYNIFLLDMQNLHSSGLMSAGVNNYEGEVIWTQSYYLNAFIDLLIGSEYFPTEPAILSLLKLQIKHRLDFEMALLDKMMQEGPGLLCKTFTVDRTPTLHAVQTGKFLLLMKRYMDLSNSIELNSFESFRQQVIELDGHIEVLVRAEKDDKWLEGGRFYLEWPRGSAFWADGVGLPYNHQNCWAAGVLFGEEFRDLPENVQKAVLDISSQVLDYEGFRNFIPKHSIWYSSSPEYFEWFYWWGLPKIGWIEMEDVSQNTPNWHGDGDNVAAPVYRTFDAIAILTAGEFQESILPKGIIKYFVLGLEKDGLELFLTPYLARYNEKPEISWEVASKNLRVECQSDFRNAVWAYLYLTENILK